MKNRYYLFFWSFFLFVSTAIQAQIGAIVEKGADLSTLSTVFASSLDDLLQLNEQNFVNEGYTINLGMMDLALTFEENESVLNSFTVQLNPNPIQLQETILSINNSAATTLFISIYTANGQLVKSYEEQIAAGIHHQRLELPNVSGTYFVQMYTAEGNFEQRKLVKL